jgi:NAD(P)-dependent dehydrogenase (short-subunit alcohol dehydrogenase family)
MIDPGLQGRVALVTGANQGIGAATARALAAQDAAVFLTYLRLGDDDPGVQATARPAYAAARPRRLAEFASVMGESLRNQTGYPRHALCGPADRRST